MDDGHYYTSAYVSKRNQLTVKYFERRSPPQADRKISTDRIDLYDEEIIEALESAGWTRPERPPESEEAKHGDNG